MRKKNYEWCDIVGGGVGVLWGRVLVVPGLIAKVMGVDPERKTPAFTKRDNVDYIPAHPTVLFGHHFAAIAGAGPIVGPVLAAQFGWVSVTLWIILGCIFIGAAHDMIALILSVRHEGESIGSVIGKIMGPLGKVLFLLFSWSALILVVAVFASQIAGTFVADPAIATSSLLFIAEAIVFGICVNKLKMPVLWASLIFVPLMFAFVWIGKLIPLDLMAMFGLSKAATMMVWCVVLLVYCFFASTCPVWILLQPRDYLNAYLLYAMMILGILGVFVAHPALNINAFTGLKSFGSNLPLMPILFVTVACGACSGFHSLVASGTSSKQLDNEKNARPIAYGGMLLEGVLAMIALIGVAGTYASQGEYTAALGGMTPVAMFASSVAGFCAKLGIPLEIAKGFMLLSVSAFLMTTVDAGTRLARFSWQELLGPRESQPHGAGTSGFLKLARNMYVGTLLVCVLAAGFLMGGEKTTTSLWTLFASANQLLATLTLVTMTIWFLKNKKPYFMTAIPAAFMMVVSSWALILKFVEAINKADILMAATSIFLLGLGAVVVVLAIKEIKCLRK